MRFAKAWLVVALFLVPILGLIGYRMHLRMQPKPPQIEIPIAVSVIEAETRDLHRYARIVGVLQPAQASNLALKVPGRIQSIRVKMGQEVSRGDILITLDSSDLENQLRAAEAAYEIASANLARVAVSSSVLEGAQAEASVKQASAQVAAAVKNHERMSTLVKQGAVPAVQLETAETQLNIALAQLELATKNLEAVREGSSEALLKVATAQRKQAEASLELARSQLRAASLIAPFDGIVSFVNANVGEMVSSGLPVVGLVEKGALVAEFMVSEKQVRSVSVAQALDLKVPVLSASVQGTVTGISPVPDARSRLFKVRVEVRGGAAVRAGTMVEANLLEESRLSVLVVPQECVVGGVVEPAVFVVMDGKAIRRPVRLGISDGSFVEVLSGLMPGERVVSQGQTFLRSGRSVLVQAGGTR